MSGYPKDWPVIAKRIKDSANWRCERCNHKHEPETGYYQMFFESVMEVSDWFKPHLAGFLNENKTKMEANI